MSAVHIGLMMKQLPTDMSIDELAELVQVESAEPDLVDPNDNVCPALQQQDDYSEDDYIEPRTPEEQSARWSGVVMDPSVDDYRAVEYLRANEEFQRRMMESARQKQLESAAPMIHSSVGCHDADDYRTFEYSSRCGEYPYSPDDVFDPRGGNPRLAQLPHKIEWNDDESIVTYQPPESVHTIRIEY